MLDVALILDASGSMEDFEFTQDAARYIAMGLNFKGGRVRVAVITYQATTTVRFPLNEYTIQLEVTNALSFNNNRNIHGTNTASAIRRMRQDIFNVANGDRSAVDNVALLFSDGQSNLEVGSLTREVLLSRQSGIRIITIGIGNTVTDAELEAIASIPTTDNVFKMENAGRIESVGDQILDQLCV
jgi:collagen type VI alpha